MVGVVVGVVQKAELHGRGRIDYHNHLFEVFGAVIEQRRLVGVQLQLVVVHRAGARYGLHLFLRPEGLVIAVYLAHGAGDIEALAAGAGKGDYRRVVVRFYGVVGVHKVGYVRFACGQAAYHHAVAGIAGRARARERAVGIERFQCAVDLESRIAERRSKSAHSVIQVFAEQRDLAARCQRERAVFVFEQNGALRHYLPRYVLSGFDYFGNGVVIGKEVVAADRLFLSASRRRRGAAGGQYPAECRARGKQRHKAERRCAQRHLFRPCFHSVTSPVNPIPLL